MHFLCFATQNVKPRAICPHLAIRKNFYYANGSYYDPETGSYLDASPISTVFENAFSPRRLDRNGIMCDNVLELAGNPDTATTNLSTDPNYDGTRPTTWLGRAIVSVLKWYRGLPKVARLAIGGALFVLSLILAAATGGASAAAQVTIEVAIGVGVGIGVWAISALATGQQLTWDGLANAAIDSFLVSSLFAFVQQSVNAIKYAYRVANVPTYSSEFLEWLNKGDANYSVYKAM